MWQSCSPRFPNPAALHLVPFRNRISCFVSRCVSSDKSLPSVRQEPTFKPWKGSLFLQQNQSWIFTVRTHAEAETPVLWASDVKNWVIWKYPDAGKDWRQEEKGTTEDELVGWHHWLDKHEFEQAPGVGNGQERLGWCIPRGHKELDGTKRLNWTEKQGSRQEMKQ